MCQCTEQLCVAGVTAAEWSGSERELAVPCKRRRHNSDPGVQDDESDEPPSRSSSLLQFENLERHCESRLSHDSLEAGRWRPTDSPDSLEDSAASSGDDDAVSRSFSSRSGNGSFRSLGMRSSRSFDSLVLCQSMEKPGNNFLGGELSQSLNNTSIPSENAEPAPAPRGIYKTVECLTDVKPHVACSRTTTQGQGICDLDSPSACEAKTSTVSTKGSERSAENLSEDSGFGEHTSSTDLAATRGRTRDVQSSERGSDEPMGWEATCDARAKYNQHFNWQSAPDLAAPAQCKSVPDLYTFSGSKSLIIDYVQCKEVVVVSNTDSSSSKVLEEPKKMASRFSSVASTPNLYSATQEFLASERSDWRRCAESTVSLSRVKYDSVSRLSSATGSSRGSRGSNIQITTSFVNLSYNGSSKGVHFCPVVSEVSWRESSSNTSSGSSECDEDSETPPFEQLVERLRASPVVARGEREERRRVISELSTLRLEREAPPRHVGMGPAPRALSLPVTVPDERPTMEDHRVKKKHGLGGFFQRFSFRRLSGRDKKKDKKKKILVNSSTSTQSEPVKVRDRDEEDFKIIPLHAPSDSASAERKPTPPEPPPARARVRRPQRSPVMATATAARGLLETDIDSDIAPANKKTRSLLNLDDGRNTLKPCPVQREDSRESDSRAKSMEFLLDKDNQAAIKVRLSFSKIPISNSMLG